MGTYIDITYTDIYTLETKTFTSADNLIIDASKPYKTNTLTFKFVVKSWELAKKLDADMRKKVQAYHPEIKLPNPNLGTVFEILYLNNNKYIGGSGFGGTGDYITNKLTYASDDIRTLNKTINFSETNAGIVDIPYTIMATYYITDADKTIYFPTYGSVSECINTLAEQTYAYLWYQVLPNPLAGQNKLGYYFIPQIEETAPIIEVSDKNYVGNYQEVMVSITGSSGGPVVFGAPTITFPYTQDKSDDIKQTLEYTDGVGNKKVINGTVDKTNKRVTFSLEGPLKTGTTTCTVKQNYVNSTKVFSKTFNINVYDDLTPAITYPSTDSQYQYSDITSIKWTSSSTYDPSCVSEVYLYNKTNGKRINLDISQTTISPPSRDFYKEGVTNRLVVVAKHKYPYFGGIYTFSSNELKVDVSPQVIKFQDISYYSQYDNNGSVSVRYKINYSGGMRFMKLFVYDKTHSEWVINGETFSYSTDSGTYYRTITGLDYETTYNVKVEFYYSSSYSSYYYYKSDNFDVTTLKKPFGNITLTSPINGEKVKVNEDDTEVVINFKWNYSQETWQLQQNEIYYDLHYGVYPNGVSDYYSSPQKSSLSTNMQEVRISKDELKSKYNVTNIDDLVLTWWVVAKRRTDYSYRIHSSTETFGFETIVNQPPTKPTLVSPQNGQVDIDVSNVTFEWNQSTDPEGDQVTYDLYLGKDSQSLNKINDTPITETTFTYTGTLDELQTYFWKILQSDGKNEVSSDLWNFKTRKVQQPPTSFNLLTPTYNQSFSTKNLSISINFSWEEQIDPDGGNVTYNLYYKKSSQSSYTKISGLTTTMKTITFNLPSGQGTYYWYVEQVDDEGEVTKTGVSVFKINFINSAPNSFNLISPTNGSIIDLVNDMTTFQWEQQVDPDGDPVVYDLYVGKYGGTLSKIQSGLSRTNYTARLNYDTLYQWKVVARDNKGQSTSSQIWQFRTNPENQPPLPFSLISPQNESVDLDYHSVTFEWNATTDPEGGNVTYNFYLSKSQKFSTLEHSETGLTTTTLTLTELSPETTYFWKVEQVDNEGRVRSSDIWYFTTKTNLYIYKKYYESDYGLFVKEKFVDSKTGLDKIDVSYELINAYESNVFLTYRNNEIVNRTQYVPYIDFGNILHKQYDIKINDSLNDLLTTFTLDLNNIHNDNVIFEIDKPTDNDYLIRNKRYSYVLKDTPQNFVETYEKTYTAETDTVNLPSTALGMVLNADDTGTSSSDIFDMYKNVLEDLRKTYVSEMKIIVSPEMQAEMIKRITKMYLNKEPIIQFLMNHVFHLSELNINDIATRIQLPQLWKQYVVQQYQKDLTYSEIYQIISDYFKLQEKNQMNLKFIDYVQGYGSFNLELYLKLRDTLDDFTKQFDPFFYELQFELPESMYNQIISELLNSYNVDSEKNVYFNEKSDIMKMMNRYIYQEKVLKGEQTINQQLIYNDVNELVDYLNYYDSKGFKSDLLYSYYYNKIDLIEQMQKNEGLKLKEEVNIDGTSEYVEEDVDKFILYPNEQRITIMKETVFVIVEMATGDLVRLEQDRDGILYDLNNVDFGYVENDRIVVFKNENYEDPTITVKRIISFGYEYDKNFVYNNREFDFNEVVDKSDFLTETETELIIKLNVPQKYRIEKNSLLIQIGNMKLYDVDNVIQTDKELNTPEDYKTKIVGSIDYGKGLIRIPKESLPNITLDDFEKQYYRLEQINTKLNLCFNTLLKPVDIERKDKDFKERTSMFIYTKYLPSDLYYYQGTDETKLLKLHLEVYYRMLINKTFTSESLYDDKFDISRNQLYPIYFYKKNTEVFPMNDMTKLYRNVIIPYEEFEKLVNILKYETSLYILKVNKYPLENQLEYFKELYPTIDIVDSEQVYESIDNAYSLLTIRTNDDPETLLNEDIELYGTVEQKRRLLVSLSNSMITVELNDDLNTDDYLDIMHKQRNYIVYQKKFFKPDDVEYFNMYEYEGELFKKQDGNDTYLSYFMPFSMNQSYTVSLFDKEGMKLDQNKDETKDRIQVIIPDKFDFIVNQEGQMYKLNWR